MSQSCRKLIAKARGKRDKIMDFRNFYFWNSEDDQQNEDHPSFLSLFNYQTRRFHALAARISFRSNKQSSTGGPNWFSFRNRNDQLSTRSGSNAERTVPEVSRHELMRPWIDMKSPLWISPQPRNLCIMRAPEVKRATVRICLTLRKCAVQMVTAYWTVDKIFPLSRAKALNSEALYKKAEIYRIH